MKKAIQALRKHPFLVLSALIPVAVVGFLVLISVYSADDFSYSTYLNDGLGSYIEKMIWHYEMMNGRVVVHVAAHLLLRMGSVAFALVGILLTVLIPWFAARSAGLSKKAAVFGTGLFAIGITAIPSQVLCQSLLWKSAFCNYFLPTAMLCGLLTWFNRLRSKQSVPIYQYILLAVYACLCGATTEQTGLLTVALSLYFAVSTLWHRKKQFLPFAIAAITALIGVWTIFASPATDARLALETGVNQGLFDLLSLQAAFGLLVQILQQTPVFCILLLLFFALGGTHLFFTLKHRFWALWTGIPALGAVAVPFIGEQADLFYALLLIAALVLAVQLLFCRAEIAGLLTLLGIGSMLVMLPTTSTGGRVLMPIFLLLIAADTLLIASLTADRKRSVRCGIWGAALGLSLFYMIPLLLGCIHNYKIDQQNKAHVREARETGILYYCADYDLDYTHSKPYTADYCFHDYLDSVGFSQEECEFYFYDSRSSAIFVNGKRTMLPTYQNEQGETLYPLRNFYETMGATVGWDESAALASVTYQGRVFYVHYLSATEATVFWTDSDGQEHSIPVTRASNRAYTYLSEAAISEPFGLTVERTDDHTITVHP